MTDNIYYNWFSNLALTTFKWKNLPDTVDPRFLELCLYFDGLAVFFYDDIMGYLCLQCMINGELNVYRVPVRRTAYATNGYFNYDLTEENSVVIFNNYTRTNTFYTVSYYAQKVANVDKTMDINLNAQKTPIALRTSENQRLTTENAFKKYEGNGPVIVLDESFNPNTFGVLNLQAPYLVDKLQQQKREYINEFLTQIGVTSTNNQKKERLISDEVNTDLGMSVSSIFPRLDMRKQACEKINALFGLNIDVEYNKMGVEELMESYKRVNNPEETEEEVPEDE